MIPASSNDEADFYKRIVGKDQHATLDEIAKTLEKQPEPRFAEFLRGIRWFIRQGSIPSNLQSWQVARLRIFAKELVGRGWMRPTVLAQFPRPDSN